MISNFSIPNIKTFDPRRDRKFMEDIKSYKCLTLAGGKFQV